MSRTNCTYRLSYRRSWTQRGVRAGVNQSHLVKVKREIKRSTLVHPPLGLTLGLAFTLGAKSLDLCYYPIPHSAPPYRPLRFGTIGEVDCRVAEGEAHSLVSRHPRQPTHAPSFYRSIIPKASIPSVIPHVSHSEAPNPPGPLLIRSRRTQRSVLGPLYTSHRPSLCDRSRRARTRTRIDQNATREKKKRCSPASTTSYYYPFIRPFLAS